MRQGQARYFRQMLMAAALAAAGGPAAAQAALFDETALIAACQQQSCITGVEDVLNNLRAQQMAEDDFNSQIGFLAAILLNAAETTEAEALPQLGAALEVLGKSSSDPRQSAAIGQVAQAVGQGEAAAVRTSGAYASSPSRPFNRWNRPRRPFQSNRFREWYRNRWSDFWRQ